MCVAGSSPVISHHSLGEFQDRNNSKVTPYWIDGVSTVRQLVEA